MRLLPKFVVFSIVCSLLCGCATVTELTKGILGTSVKEIERARKKAIVKTFDYDYSSCYTKVIDTLGRIGAYIYAKDTTKKLIAFYMSSTDTTPVGIFLKDIGPFTTQVEVSSPSTRAKEQIATVVFSALEGKFDEKENKIKKE